MVRPACPNGFPMNFSSASSLVASSGTRLFIFPVLLSEPKIQKCFHQARPVWDQQTRVLGTDNAWKGAATEYALHSRCYHWGRTLEDKRQGIETPCLHHARPLMQTGVLYCCESQIGKPFLRKTRLQVLFSHPVLLVQWFLKCLPKWP